MRKKIFSILGILILGLNTVFCQAVEISFVNLDSQDREFYIDEEYSQHTEKDSQEKVLEDENLISENENILNSSLNTQESSLVATENNYEDKKISRINNLLNSEEQVIENLSIPENLSYTTIDITDVFTGNIISHDCNLYLISNFDETEHWNECSVCGKILNKEEHNYHDDGWTGGNANICNNQNIHVFSCECGHSYSNTTGKKAHNMIYKWSNHGYYRVYVCSVCNQPKTAEDSTIDHYCQTADGKKVNCDNIGKCAICGYTHTVYHVYTINRKNIDFPDGSEVFCYKCNKKLGTLNYATLTESNGTFNLKTSISINGSYSSFSSNFACNYSNISTTSTNKNTLSLNTSFKFNTHTEYNVYVAHCYFWKYSGVEYGIEYYAFPYQDLVSPIITNINSNTGEWTTDSTISITGTENYCNSVNLTLKDTEGNIYAENVKATVTNGNWSYEIKPSLESQDNTEFILQVTDTLNNVTEQSFFISKVDAIPPKVVETETLNTEWSKTKDYILMTTDYGIGQVRSSVINTDNYEPNTENENIFYKGYTFTGDAYGEVYVPVYFKDGLENGNMEFIAVSNIDNTAPTIENVELNKSLYNTEITISANDINDKLNASGSGVTGYAISKENEIPDTFKEENTFNLTESGIYYLFVTDAVGNVSSQELNVSIKYKATINPDGGTWKGDTNPKEYITDEPVNLYPEPEKEGYTFKEWNIDGEAEITEDGDLIIEGDVTVTPIWEANKYPVTFIDYNITHNKELNRSLLELPFNSEISGTYLGNDETDNAYYHQYRLVSDTSITVSTNPENNIVYRYFEFCYTEKESHLNFNDNDNADGLRPETYKLQLILEDGTSVQEVILPTTEPDYIFENLPKYDEQGEEYNYKIVPIISNRYDVLPNPEDETTPEIIYSSPACSINIPKITTLDGKNGDLTYKIQMTSNLFYKDKIILVPEENVTLTDGVKNMNATITQDKTTFTKEDVLQVTGKIQTTKKHFAGTWTGTFNFKIKYEVSN